MEFYFEKLYFADASACELDEFDNPCDWNRLVSGVEFYRFHPDGVFASQEELEEWATGVADHHTKRAVKFELRRAAFLVDFWV